MQNEKIHLERIKRLIARLKEGVFHKLEPLDAQYVSAEDPIPWESLNQLEWQKIKPGEVWSQAWGSGWFKISGRLNNDYPKSAIGLWFDCEGEACMMVEGTPYQGFTPKVDWYHNAAKHYLPLDQFVSSDESFELFIEAAANDLFGAGKKDYSLAECSLCVFDKDLYHFALDIELLYDLATALPDKTVRRAKIIYGLNEICNLYAGTPEAARQIAKDLLASPANASALKAISVGHAHLDLAWLWPIRETRRKGGRTFANALRLLQTYPQYIFGASQAQLYAWIKEDYPSLYDEVKQAVKEGRWEIQGASWVEFDTNLPSGESIIRQFAYGRAFFAQEFGIVPNCLWLPDCFGFSGNLPQLMKGCKVDWFVTQKLSWNESNLFDKHLFVWQGIDGTEVLAHQLPTNDYNFSNNPSAFIATEGRFAQSELADSHLNLYGIGDGGGGPTANHIEYGIRQQNLEGVSRLVFAKAQDFYHEFCRLDHSKLPKAYTELYLEFHRGTYTTQAVMKKDNRTSEKLLAASEWITSLAGIASGQQSYPQVLDPIWKDTLLLQFHDILPGSSIDKVYQDARTISQHNHELLAGFIEVKLATDNAEGIYSIFNPAPTRQWAWLSFPKRFKDCAAILDCVEINQVIERNHEIELLLQLEPFSKKELRFATDIEPLLQEQMPLQSDADGYILQNSKLKVKVSHRGSILSIQNDDTQFLSSESNLLQLWEDIPNNWGAWDINHFYRQTTPQMVSSASLVEAFSLGSYSRIVQRFSLGNSTVVQTIELMPAAHHVLIHHEVDWCEEHKMLRVAFSSDIMAQEVICGVQMGYIKRSARPKNAWDAARFDFPAQGYVAQSESSRTCAILSGAKYGFSALENCLELALLRSPADVDPKADLGHQSYTYAYFCDGCSFEEARLAELSMGIETDLICSPGRTALQALPIYLQKDSTVLCTIKPANQGNAIILRLFEPLGRHTSQCLFSEIPLAAIHKCNLLEEPYQEIKHDKDWPVKPFEIITLRLELA